MRKLPLVTFLAILLAVNPPAATLSGQSSSSINNRSLCRTPQCTIVHVDGVSKGSESDIYGTQPHTPLYPTTNIRVSDSKITYQLTCNPDNKSCVAPRLGSEYQFVAIPGEKPDDMYDYEHVYPHLGKTVFLKRANETLGPYWMVAEMPAMPTSTFQKLIAECDAREHGLSENDCTRWLSRRAWMHEAGCPDSEAAVACRSFQQWIGAVDPDLLDIFARLEHVYVCFHPQEDEFFTLWFGEPNEFSCRKAEADDQKVYGVQNGMLIQISIFGIYYYDKGV